MTVTAVKILGKLTDSAVSLFLRTMMRPAAMALEVKIGWVGGEHFGQLIDRGCDLVSNGIFGRVEALPATAFQLRPSSAPARPLPSFSSA